MVLLRLTGGWHASPGCKQMSLRVSHSKGVPSNQHAGSDTDRQPTAGHGIALCFACGFGFEVYHFSAGHMGRCRVFGDGRVHGVCTL